MNSAVKLLRCIHPVLLVSVGAGVIASLWLANEGGPCPSPLILVFLIISLGIAAGIILTVCRLFLWVIERPGKKSESS